MRQKQSLHERLERIRTIGEMALSGKTDEEISNQMNEKPYSIQVVRHTLGISLSRIRNIMVKPKVANVNNGHIGVSFGIPREYTEDLGISVDDLDNGLEYKGEIKDRKLILTFHKRYSQ